MEPIKSEGKAIPILLFCWFFLTICAYYVLRPVRSALVLADFGPKALPWVYMGTAICTGMAVWVYTRFTHLPRRFLLGSILLFFSLNLIGWHWVFQKKHPWASPAFYIWVDVFSIMGPTVFWIYVNDLYPPLNAKRFYGLIGSAGPLGAIAGAALARYFVDKLGILNMLLVAAACYLLGLAVFSILEIRTEGHSATRTKMLDKFDAYNFSEFSTTLRSIFSSRVLFLLSVVVCFERFAPDFVDYLFNTVAHQAYPEKIAFVTFYASFDLWRNILAFLATLLLTPKILKNFGVHIALVAVPVTILLGSVAFAALPVLWVAVATKGLEEGQRHAWFKAGKEVLYTATSSDVIYKVKSYVEMFFYRLARGFAGFLILICTSFLGLGPRGLALMTVPLALLWAQAAWRLGKDFEALVCETPSPP